ncbi:MAG: plasmid mobilization relaxosome protein MobC [Lachnospiraceae bacterium]|nr:plasmid mobilization relaxosome protein MobC [Lachnospiraceae bacterium]
MQYEGRKIPVQLYLTEEENRILTEKMQLTKERNKSAFIRRMILEGYLLEVDFSELNRYNFLLNNISNNINQIAHRINETRSIFQTDIDSIKEEMKKLWQLQRSMLSSLPWAKR